MQYQGIDEQLVVNKGLVPIARELNMPLVATNDVHYLTHGDHHPHDILLCIGTGKNVNDRDRLRYHGDQFYLKTAAEMQKVFGEMPEALANTVRIAERCRVDIPSDKNYLPNFAVPAPYTLNDYFEHVVREGFAQRLARLQALHASGSLRHPIEDYENRLSYEIEMIKRMEYPGYFLIVWDFIRYAREKGIPVGPGRGSAAGSLVAYCLRITDVDPLDYDLIFERFLNPERVSLPDIDIDFCERRRGEVIEYVTQKYGRENVAQIITFGTMKARAVVRDVGRSLDIPFADVDRVAKLIPPTLDMTLEKALEEVPQLKQLNEQDQRVKELIAVARRLEGMTRHASVHAAGVVIAPRAITEFAPLYKGKNDEITTQWAMKEIERIGLLKMDFLGLSTLTLLNDAVEHIRATTGETVDLDSIPLDDAKTYQIFCGRRGVRHLPVRKLGHARHSAQGQAAAARRSHRVERALPSRPAAQRHGGRFHRPQARPREGELRSQRARADSRRHLRRHRLPGTGHAHRQRPGRLHARRGRPAAQGDGQEESRRHAGAAAEVRGRRDGHAASTRRRPRRFSI